MKTVKTNTEGYGYKYTDMAGIHEYLESIKASYYQYIETVEGNDYIMTVPIIDGKELPTRKGCRVVQAILAGKANPAQEQGSALTYARRYSLLMAFGLATEDDDGEALTNPRMNRDMEKGKPYARVQTESSRATTATQNGELATEKQINLMKSLMNSKAGITTKEEYLDYLKEIGYEEGKITKKQASLIIDKLQTKED
jgi:hypothetical protein